MRLLHFFSELFLCQKEEINFILFDIVYQHSYSNVIGMRHIKNNNGKKEMKRLSDTYTVFSFGYERNIVRIYGSLTLL